MKLIRIDQTLLPSLWERLDTFIERLIEAHPSGSYTPHGVYASLMANQMQLWVASPDDSLSEIIAIMGTSVSLNMAGKPVCRVHFLVGDDIYSWIHLKDVLEELCELNGVVTIEIVARKGLGKILSDYEATYAVFRKEITPKKPEEAPSLKSVQPAGRA